MRSSFRDFKALIGVRRLNGAPKISRLAGQTRARTACLAPRNLRAYCGGGNKRIQIGRWTSHGFKSIAAWLMPVLEQLLRFFNFGEISPRFKIDEDWREH